MTRSSYPVKLTKKMDSSSWLKDYISDSSFNYQAPPPCPCWGPTVPAHFVFSWALQSLPTPAQLGVNGGWLDSVMFQTITNTMGSGDGVWADSTIYKYTRHTSTKPLHKTFFFFPFINSFQIWFFGEKCANFQLNFSELFTDSQLYTLKLFSETFWKY